MSGQKGKRKKVLIVRVKGIPVGCVNKEAQDKVCSLSLMGVITCYNKPRRIQLNCSDDPDYVRE